MKFKVGDKVKVRKDLKNGFYGIDSLEDYQNDKVFTIKNAYNDSYFLEEDKEQFCFLENMLIPANEEITLKGIFVKEEDNKKVYKLKLGELDWENFYNIDGDLYLCIKKEEILADKEKEYLSAVIKPFRDKVKYILKNHSNMGEYITICATGEYINFPYFEKDTMYKNMEIDEKYSLKELGL